EPLHPRTRRGEIVHLEDRHVAAVAAAAAGEEARGRRVLAYRRHHLEEVAAHRQHGVAQAEVRDARIAESHLDPERARQRGDRAVEVAGDEGHLAQAQHDRDSRPPRRARPASAYGAGSGYSTVQVSPEWSRARRSPGPRCWT